MAVAWGYNLAVYKAFILSLRQTAGYDGDAVLLAPALNRTRPEAVDLCTSYNVRLLDFWQLPGLAYAKGGMPPFMMGERFRMYSALCRAPYTWCLAVDFRDVFFQTNPFEHVMRVDPDTVTGPELVLPLEDRVIGTCTINGPMIRRCFGKDVLREIGNRSVLCSGVILGTPSAYAALRIIGSLVHSCPMDKMSDQASLNYAILSHEGWSKLSAELAKHEGARPRGPLRVLMETRGAGFANTVGSFKGADRTMQFEREHMRDGLILNNDHSVSPVVHQYDRLLKSTGPGAVHLNMGKSDRMLQLKAINDALGGPRANASWLPAGA